MARKRTRGADADESGMSCKEARRSGGEDDLLARLDEAYREENARVYFGQNAAAAGDHVGGAADRGAGAHGAAECGAHGQLIGGMEDRGAPGNGAVATGAHVDGLADCDAVAVGDHVGGAADCGAVAAGDRVGGLSGCGVAAHGGAECGAIEHGAGDAGVEDSGNHYLESSGGFGIRAIALDVLKAVCLSHQDAAAAQVSVPNVIRAASSNDGDGDLLNQLDSGYLVEQKPNHRFDLHRERDRLYQRRCRQKKRDSSSKCGSSLNPVSDEIRAKALKRLQHALGPSGLDESVCVSCDRLVPRCESVRKEASDWKYMAKMRCSLGEVDPTLPQTLKDAYCAPGWVPYLRGIAVSPRSFRSYTNADGHLTAWFNVCKRCNGDVERGNLPKFAISNGFYVGHLPEQLGKLTLPERFLTQLVNISAMTRVMRGGRHRCIRSHCVAFDCTPAPPVALLPRSLSDVSSFRVVMVGDFTDPQLHKVKKMHRIRGKHVRALFEFYKENNSFYSDAVYDVHSMWDLIDAELAEQLILEHIEDEGGVVEGALCSEHENIRGRSDAWRVISELDELSVVERRIGLSDASQVLLSRDHEVAAGSGAASAAAAADGRAFLVKRSNQLATEASGDLFAKMFPHLFPYGHGHPGDLRQVRVSFQECIKHYTMLSSRQFAEDELFTLVAFDRISMQNMYVQNSIRCQRFPDMYRGYESIGADELGKALLENEQRLQGRRPQNREPGSLARKFLHTVEIATGSVWGSNAERSKCRQKAYAYQTRFGQPALFITLTPNTDSSLAMAHYAGVTSVDTLFDILNATLPSKTELREASLGNDSASARLFMKNVDAFIEHVLGIDPATRRQTPLKGLVGEVKAFFGMVETQGRGTLHIHFLIWLKHTPSSIHDLEQSMNGPNGNSFRSTMASYVRSIVSNDLPLPVREFSCTNCGAPFSKLVGLPIPPQSRRNPGKRLFSTRAREAVSEPALVQCGVCMAKYSSQYVLRHVLLKHRPLHWPPWEQALTAGEIQAAAIKETECRHTISHACDAVNEREKLQQQLRRPGKDDCVATTTFKSEHMLLQQSNLPQMPMCKTDDDPFLNDDMTRLIEMLPPMPSDSRLSSTNMDYMVSTLVNLLNQHYWTHTSSCFKTSKTTVNDSYCRYLFPRDRHPQTTFDLTGVLLERTIAHEYINGFNYEIMAAFKCNHDIQFLLGGKDVADRIHYCTKYVTKQQKRLDSVVVTALAAFRRRQERETISASLNEANSSDSLSVARNRVASMVYTMTNRQEIAGPLAALYLYRGSCCYESSSCSYVPLSDIVRQLSSSEEYSCNLVSEDGENGSSRYLTVSFLDDYIYRHDKLNKLNVYEFAIRYYRKKNGCTGKSALPFMVSHPLHRTHSLGTRQQEAVPVLQGFRVPYVADHSSEAIQCKRAILSLVLFKHFRSLEDLIGSVTPSNDCWLEAYTAWETTRSDFVTTIMHHIDDYYCGVERAKAQLDAMSDQLETQTAPGVGGGCSDSDEDDSDECDSLFGADDVEDDAEETIQQHGGSCADLINPWQILDSSSRMFPDTQTLNPLLCPTSAKPDARVTRILGVFKAQGLLRSNALATMKKRDNLIPQERMPPVQTMRKWVQDPGTDMLLEESSIGRPTTATRVVELLDDALQEDEMVWIPSGIPIDTSIGAHTPPFASITAISRIYTLNEKQHCAFKLIGHALLTRWQHAEDLSYSLNDGDDALRRDQLRLFLGGEGGTGKSRVLDAVQELCGSWGRSECVVKTALTGKAATLINGRTLAGFLLQLRSKRKLSSAIYLDILVIDEISMMRKTQLAQLDKLLRAGKRMPTIPFGGVHVVLVGDFLQLPPVGGEPLYKDPCLSRRQSANELAGWALWRSFDNIILLEESVRFRADPEWGQGCHFARKGIWLPEFVNLINSRVVSQSDSLEKEFSSAGTIASFITPDNATRLAINNLYISSAAKLMNGGDYPVRVVANFKGKLEKLGASEVKMIRTLPDTKFGRMAPYLDLIAGMPIQVTQNVRPEKAAANGTLGVLETIVYHPDTEFCAVYDSVAGVTVKIPSHPPTALIVRIHRGSTAASMPGCTDSDLFPLFYDSRPYSTCDIRLAPSGSGMPRSLSIRIEQFPLVCGVSSTVYKVQGDTLDNMVVTEWRSENRIVNKREQPYLLVSRVTSRFSFRSFCPLTDEIIRWARPSSDALEEESRLQLLSERTLQRLKPPQP